MVPPSFPQPAPSPFSLGLSFLIHTMRRVDLGIKARKGLGHSVTYMRMSLYQMKVLCWESQRERDQKRQKCERRQSEGEWEPKATPGRREW